MKYNIVLDKKLEDKWESIRKCTNKDLLDFLNEAIIHESLKLNNYKISKSINKISGSLSTKMDYKKLKERMIDERLKDYENFS